MRILSGIQPTGRLHLGNYFGMMEPSLRLQHEGEALYFIADYHGLTTIHDAAELRKNVREVAVDFLACGLDPDKATFFRQSDVPEVAELTWILNCVTPVPMLENAHSYKDKTAHGIIPSAGLFGYPVLMAADILIYDSDVVPVGQDQKQHLEMTRDVAAKFNHRYGGEFLKLPKALIRESTAIVPGLDGQKMSKSYNNTIPLFEDEKLLRKKIMGIVTDSTPVEAPKDPDKSALIDFYRLVAPPEEVTMMEESFRAGGEGYGTYKQRLFDALWEFFRAARERRNGILADAGGIEKVLSQGAIKARALARPVLDRVRKACGL
ncbi:MAG: tryptophan--tRNA ligase [Verrucomicrobiales bacterium]